MNEELEKKRQPCDVYQRVVGWITPVRNWNKGKQSEFKDRVNYDNKKNWD